MSELLENLDVNQYVPLALDWTTNILLAVALLLIGLWVASSVNKLVVGISKKHAQLDDTLFRFLGSVARYIVLAFVVIAILGVTLAYRQHRLLLY
ncbi:hypothetical protein PEC18_00035 [Paucibacter sp. O1-1]|nr:hypothetical protein [Paucibacter sp. O1-1]MDA3824319.1 hypothetical protein [Paucibacter sp. O1-1]